MFTLISIISVVCSNAARTKEIIHVHAKRDVFYVDVFNIGTHRVRVSIAKCSESRFNNNCTPRLTHNTIIHTRSSLLLGLVLNENKKRNLLCCGVVARMMIT